MDRVAARLQATRDTTANWNAHLDFIPRRGEIIIYTDHGRIDDGHGGQKDVPGVKIGDGSAYLIDLPFAGTDVEYRILAELREHTGNEEIHVTQTDKDFWNSKLNCTVNKGNLIFNRL